MLVFIYCHLSTTTTAIYLLPLPPSIYLLLPPSIYYYYRHLTTTLSHSLALRLRALRALSPRAFPHCAPFECLLTAHAPGLSCFRLRLALPSGGSTVAI